jgi:hypothetical protein
MLKCPYCETELDRVMVQPEAEEYRWSEKDGLYQDRTDGLDWLVYCPHCKHDLTDLLFREPEGYVLEEPSDPPKMVEGPQEEDGVLGG